MSKSRATFIALSTLLVAVSVSLIVTVLLRDRPPFKSGALYEIQNYGYAYGNDIVDAEIAWTIKFTGLHKNVLLAMDRDTPVNSPSQFILSCPKDEMLRFVEVGSPEEVAKIEERYRDPLAYLAKCRAQEQESIRLEDKKREENRKKWAEEQRQRERESQERSLLLAQEKAERARQEQERAEKALQEEQEKQQQEELAKNERKAKAIAKLSEPAEVLVLEESDLDRISYFAFVLDDRKPIAGFVAGIDGTRKISPTMLKLFKGYDKERNLWIERYWYKSSLGYLRMFYAFTTAISYRDEDRRYGAIDYRVGHENDWTRRVIEVDGKTYSLLRFKEYLRGLDLRLVTTSTQRSLRRSLSDSPSQFELTEMTEVDIEKGDQ